MGSLCTPSGVHCRLFRWFLGKCFLLVVHPYMTGSALFGKCFFCNLFWGIFWRDGMKGFGVLRSVNVIMSGVGQ